MHNFTWWHMFLIRLRSVSLPFGEFLGYGLKRGFGLKLISKQQISGYDCIPSSTNPWRIQCISYLELKKPILGFYCTQIQKMLFLNKPIEWDHACPSKFISDKIFKKCCHGRSWIIFPIWIVVIRSQGCFYSFRNILEIVSFFGICASLI